MQKTTDSCPGFSLESKRGLIKEVTTYNALYFLLSAFGLFFLCQFMGPCFLVRLCHVGHDMILLGWYSYINISQVETRWLIHPYLYGTTPISPVHIVVPPWIVGMCMPLIRRRSTKKIKSYTG